MIRNEIPFIAEYGTEYLWQENICIAGLPEPPFLAGAGAVFLVQLRLLLLLYCKFFIFTGP